MVILVRGTAGSNTENYADRILAAMATTSILKYGKKTLVLQATTDLPVERVLQGKAIDASNIKSAEYSFEDSGIDALLRRIEIGHLTNEQFSDCCHNISKQLNGLDIAGISKDTGIAKTLASNLGMLRELLKNANAIYDIVYLFVRGRDTELISVLKDNDLIDQEVACIPQGPAKEQNSDSSIFYAVKNFDRLSAYTIKGMATAYGTKNIFPVPYNVMFKDACLSENALPFLSVNVTPDETDDNAYFASSLSKLVGNLIGMEEPVMKERHFVRKRKL